LLKLTTGHCWNHTFLWRGSNRVSDRPYTNHHACHVHLVSEHHCRIGNNCISKDDWLLAYLLSADSFGHLLHRDCLDPSEEKGNWRNQSLGLLWKNTLAYQEKNAAVGHSYSDYPIYFLLLHCSFSACLYIT